MKGKIKRVTALDLGSSETRAMIADIDSEGSVRIRGVASVPSQGMKGAEVNNIEEAVDAVNAAIEDAEIDGACEARSIIACIGGSSVQFHISQGIEPISAPKYEVSHENIDHALESASARLWGQDETILHTLPLDFSVDGKADIKDPLNMFGRRLEVQLMLMTASKSLARKTANTIMRGGFQTKKLILKHVAFAEAVLSRADKEIGTLVIDIGACSINVVGVIKGKPYYLRGFDYGADLITTDIAYMLNKPHALAEELKKAYGCCYLQGLTDPVSVYIPAVGSWPAAKMPQEEFCTIIESRMREIFLLIHAALKEDRVYDIFNHGIVVTGGGALLPGILHLAAETFRYPVRLGIPELIDGTPSAYKSPEYATLIGTLLYESQMFAEETMDHRRRNMPMLRYGTDEKASKRLRELLGMLF